MAPQRTPPSTLFLAVLALAGTLWVGARSVGGAPPLGPLVDPVHGVWALAGTAQAPPTATGVVPALGARVEVRFDDHGVPHIFAANMRDAARALGYVHARDRLFQLELQTRAVAGTLSEILGARALPLDREARAQGLAWAAERSYAAAAQGTWARTMVDAYAEGVNAWIDGMRAEDLPLEYRLINARPQRWRPAYTAYLIERMGLTLAYAEGELRRGMVRALVGDSATDALFPRHSPIQEPIQPNGQRAARFDWRKLPPPAAPDPVKVARARDLETAFSSFAAGPRDGLDDDVVIGSNNWAVTARRAAAGHALLAGDPHLTLTLPSIWYQAHIVVTDTFDVYGVTLVGAPLQPIGFNRDVAWSATNSGADVTDYYEETVDDAARPTKYKLDGAWKPLEQRVEVIRSRNDVVIATDTIYHSHRGVMLRVGGKWVSRRWLVTEPFDALSPFYAAGRARTAREFMDAMGAYAVPAQNFAVADRLGHAGILSSGHFPLRPSTAPRGDVVIDGSLSANDWKGFLAPKDYPQALDPAQGFVVSANQEPKDPKVDPRYMGWDWPPPWRAMRINELLRADSAVTPDAMRRYQTESRSAETAVFVPAFLAAAKASPGRDAALDAAAGLLAKWDGRFVRESEEAALFEAAMDELSRRTWDELVPRDSGGTPRTRRVATPGTDVLAELLQDPDSPWWDDVSTPQVHERRDDILRASLVAAYDRLVKRLGAPGPAWRWSAVRHENIYHLLRIPALSRLDIPVQSGPGTISPSSGDGTHGASWRMVVELGPEVRAWGIYPGGQSGNPISPRYVDLLPRWIAGELDTLRVPRRAADLSGPRLSQILTLQASP